MTDGGIRGEAGKTVGAATLEAEGKLRKGGGLAFDFVSFDETEKGFADGLRNHGGFRSALLLLEDEKRLVEMTVPTLDLLEQNWNLRVLAAEAENRGARNVGMMDVAGEQAAESVGIFTRAAAAAFVHQEFNAVNVSKHSRRRCSGLRRIEGGILQFGGLAFAIEM